MRSRAEVGKEVARISASVEDGTMLLRTAKEGLVGLMEEEYFATSALLDASLARDLKTKSSFVKYANFAAEYHGVKVEDFRR